MKQKTVRLLSFAMALCLLAGLLPTLSVPAEAASNTSKDTTIALPVGTPVSVSFDGAERHYFSFQSTKAGQFVTVSTTETQDYIYIIDSKSNSTLGSGYDKNMAKAVLGEVGTYYISITPEKAPSSDTITITLTENDGYEYNNSKDLAARVASGETVKFSLLGNDEDWFAVETTKAGQDIQLAFSGFTYANTGSFKVRCEEAVAEQSVSNNGTFHYHASASGLHYFRFYNGTSGSDAPLSLTMTATVLDGDKNECNDTLDQATDLPIGTDQTFTMGGRGDEDWFRFEVDGDGTDLYTLQFLDLNPDYSDQLFYEVYAPDGTVVTSSTYVNIHHTNILSCTQQGLYAVRIGTYGKRPSYGNGYVDLTRNPLRIRVSKGGSDPYESNDTWLTAKQIHVGQLTQHVLASTADEDWFYFTAPEADMSFAVDLDKYCYAYIYRAEDLAETGYQSDNYYFYINSSNAGYCKLEDAGVYYIRFTTTSSYVSEELRSFIVELTSAGREENNDTWDQAVSLFDTVPQRFDIAGSNDSDWFKLVVPQGTSQIVLRTSGASGKDAYAYLYREKDIVNVGLKAVPATEWNFYNQSVRTINVPAGTYLLKICGRHWYDGDDRVMNGSVQYVLTADSAGLTQNTAITLNPGVWSDALDGTRFYRLGDLKSGDRVIFSRDGLGAKGCVYLCDSNGNSRGESSYANAGFTISQDGTYYLKVCPGTMEESYEDNLDENGERFRARIRYDIRKKDITVTQIEGSDVLTLTVGDKQYLDLRAVPYDAYYNDIDWNYNGSSAVASYNVYTGCIEAKTVGTVELSFWMYSNDKRTEKTVKVNVVASVAASSVSVAGAPSVMTVGDAAGLAAVLAPATASEKVVWSSSDDAVVYVHPNGRIVAVGEGSATITATVGAGSSSAKVSVVPAAPTVDSIQSVQMDRYAVTMYLGEPAQKLYASVTPSGIAAAIRWTSSNTAAATVDQNGVVTAVAPGVSIITAAAGDHNASCIVTVQAARVRVTGISFDTNKLQIPLGGESALNPVIAPANATVKTLTWVSDDPGVATVSRTGIVRALAVGVTTIRATTMDGGFAAELTIEVTAAPQPGDVNGDGYIDSADAMLCLRSIVGLIKMTAEQEKAADVNHDGSVDAGDAIRILRYDAKLIDKLG